MSILRKRGIFILFASCLIMSMFFLAPKVHASPTTWLIEIVDAALDVGNYCSIAIDSADSPHITYHDCHWQNLKYATISLIVPGPKWAITQIDAVQQVGEFTSLALDSNDRPHISYYDEGNDDLKYTRWTGSTWAIETVDAPGNVGYYTSLALDSNDHPHISYLDVINDDLKYARWTGSAWNIETVDSTGDVGWDTSLALDSSDNPHISYFDFSNKDLKYAWWTGSAWAAETVDASGDVGRDSSIALDSNDYPRISYFDEANGDLKYAAWTGSAWSIETVDATGYVGSDTSLALNSSDNPHISYLDSTNADLKYARWTGVAWAIQTVDSNGIVGAGPSLALDSNGNPHISYRDWGIQDLKYARWIRSAWVIETVDSTGEVGLHSSLALDSEDRPHISYYDYTNKNLEFATTPDEYFATVNVTPLDSDSDGQNDAVKAQMEVDTTYSGTVRVTVHAFLVDPSAQNADLKSSSWNITGQVVDWMHPNASITLYVPAGYASGPANYMLMLTLFDSDGFLEDSYQQTNIFLHPSSTVPPPPAATIESCNLIGEKKDSFDMGEIVFVNGSGFSPSTGYNLYVVVDQATWTDGMTIPERVPDTEPFISSNTGGTIGPITVWHDPQTAGGYDIVVDVDGNGQYDIGSDVLDDNDVEATAGFVISESAISDTTPPFITVLSPESGTLTSNEVSLTFTVNESTPWMAYSLDGQENQSIAGNTTLFDLADGLHNLVVYAEDASGNVGASEIVQFTVETSEPEPLPEPFPIWAVVVILIVAGAAATLLIYFTKIRKPAGKGK